MTLPPIHLQGDIFPKVRLSPDHADRGTPLEVMEWAGHEGAFCSRVACAGTARLAKETRHSSAIASIEDRGQCLGLSMRRFVAGLAVAAHFLATCTDDSSADFDEPAGLAAEPEARKESDVEPETDQHPELEADPAPEPDTEQEPDPEPKPEPKPAPDPAPEPKPEPDPAPEPKPEPKPAPGPKPEPKPAPAPEPVTAPSPPRLTGFSQSNCRYDEQFDKMTLAIEFRIDTWGDWRVDTNRSNYSDSRYDATQWHRSNTAGAAIFDVAIANYRSHHQSIRLPIRPLYIQHLNNRDSAILDPGQEPLRTDWCWGWPPLR
jgi:hypothetical protein